MTETLRLRERLDGHWPELTGDVGYGGLRIECSCGWAHNYVPNGRGRVDMWRDHLANVLSGNEQMSDPIPDDVAGPAHDNMFLQTADSPAGAVLAPVLSSGEGRTIIDLHGATVHGQFSLPEVDNVTVRNGWLEGCSDCTHFSSREASGERDVKEAVTTGVNDGQGVPPFAPGGTSAVPDESKMHAAYRLDTRADRIERGESG